MAEADWQSSNPEQQSRRSAPGNGRGVGGAAADTRANAQAFAHSLGNTMKEVDGVVRNVTERNPYAALGAAVAVGFILGGGIPPMLVRSVVGFAGRYALAALL